MTDTIFTPSRRAFFVIAAASFAFAGCGSLLSPSNPPARIYVLDPSLGAVAGPRVSWGLVIGAPDVPNVFDNERVALERDKTMDYYADTQWTDSTSPLLQSLLVEAFEKSGRIKAVARDDGGVPGDYMLVTEVRHFEAVYDNGDGAPEIHVEIVAKMLSLPHRDMVASHDVVQTVRASANSIPAAVAAFSQATGTALSEIVSWSLDAPGGKIANSDAAADAPVATHRKRHRK